MNYDSLLGYEPVEEPLKSGSPFNFKYMPFQGMPSAYVTTGSFRVLSGKSSSEGFSLHDVDRYDTPFPMNTPVHSYGAFIADSSPEHPDDDTTPWSENHKAEYAFFAEHSGTVGHAPNLYSGHQVDKEKIRKIMRQAEMTGSMPIMWYERDWISSGPKHFKSGDKVQGDYWYLNIVMPMNRSLWLNDLWVAEDPWVFLRELKKYPAYGYSQIPDVLTDSSGKTIRLVDLWGNSINNYMAAKGYDAVEAAKHWDKDLLQSTVQFLEQLIRNEMNPRSQKITTELNKVLVGEVVIPAVGIKVGSKKRGYERVWRSPEKTREIAFFLSGTEKQALYGAWEEAVNAYIVGPSSLVSAQLARVTSNEYSPNERDIEEATSRDRITTAPTIDEKGNVVFTTTAQSSAIEKMNLPKTFTPKDMPKTLPAFYKKGEELRRDLQFNFDPSAPGVGVPGEGKRGGILPWLVGGAAAAVAAYAATR